MWQCCGVVGRKQEYCTIYLLLAPSQISSLSQTYIRSIIVISVSFRICRSSSFSLHHECSRLPPGSRILTLMSTVIALFHPLGRRWFSSLLVLFVFFFFSCHPSSYSAVPSLLFSCFYCTCIHSSLLLCHCATSLVSPFLKYIVFSLLLSNFHFSVLFFCITLVSSPFFHDFFYLFCMHNILCPIDVMWSVNIMAITIIIIIIMTIIIIPNFMAFFIVHKEEEEGATYMCPVHLSLDKE